MIRKLKIKYMELRYKHVFKHHPAPTGKHADKITKIWEKYKRLVKND